MGTNLNEIGTILYGFYYNFVRYMGHPLAAGREILEQDEAERMILHLRQPKHKALISLMYLLGSRIGELTGFWQKRCPKCEHILGKNKKMNVYGCPNQKCSNYEKKEYKKVWIEGLRASNYEIDKDERMIVFRVTTLKQRDKMVAERRRIEIPFDAPLMQYVLPYLLTLKGDEKVFNFSQRFGRKIVTKSSLGKVWSHLFRHTRGTRLAEAGYSAPEIQTYLGHKHLNSVSKYMAGFPIKLKGKALI